MTVPTVTDGATIATTWGNAVAAAINGVPLGDLSKLPRGYVAAPTVGTASAWTNATGTLSDFTVTAGQPPSLTLTLVPGRRYRFRCYTPIAGTVLGDTAVLGLAVDGVLSVNQLIPISVTGTAVAGWFEHNLIPTDALSHTYKMQGRRSAASTGSMTLSGQISANNPIVFYCEDVGAV